MEFEFIKGYENLYKINKNGEIYSCHYDKLMTPQIKEDGYLYVNLTKPIGLENNIIIYKKYKCYIHRLLGLQYIDNPENKPEIDHIDRDRKNNNINNLRWVDKKQQNNNKETNIINLNEEQQKERIVKIRERARKWAEKNRRERGIKEKVKGFDENKYRREYDKKKRENETPEQKEARLQKRREQYRLKKNVNKDI